MEPLGRHDAAAPQPDQAAIHLAARVQGTVVDDNDLFASEAAAKKDTDTDKEDKSSDSAKDKKESDSAETVDPAEDPNQAGPKKNNIDVVLVADIDWIAPIIFQLREMGNNQDMLVDWKFQNVPFVLNILDSLAGDDRFIDIRKRTRSHRILTKVEEATEEYRTKALKERDQVHGRSVAANRNSAARLPPEDRRAAKPHRPRSPHEGPADRNAADQVRTGTAT